MKILVVDDHALIREALRGLLKELKRGAIVLEASDCGRALQLITEHADLDLVLLDLQLPDRDGFSVLAELRESYPALAIVVLSAAQDRDKVVRALDLGALGFIPKTAKREVMLSALQLVLSGGVYIPPEVLTRGNPVPPGTEAAGSVSDRPPLTLADVGLTGRQAEVLALMMRGKSNKAIGRMLNLAEPTVKNHVTAVLKVLKVTNRTEAVIAVNELRLEVPPLAKS
jgi:DNA-binding NarL/FixJ family response regulator